MELSIELGTIVLFGSMLLILITGLPVVFVMGGIATLFTILLNGFDATMGIYMSIWSTFTIQMLLAIPLFLLMASVLQHSGIADDAYEMFHKWMGGLNGGLAIGTVVVCLIFAALTGTSGAATVSMGLIAIPSMLKRGYNKHMVIGTVAAGGVIGIIVPPSVIMILYAMIAHEPIGKMFLGGVVPGTTGAILFCIYIGIRSWINPQFGPALPPSERATWIEKLISLKAMILPILLIVAVLGSIWGGMATPTEAAAVGAFGSFICAGIYGRLNPKMLKDTTTQAFRLTAMAFWILGAATAFSNLYTQMGAREMIQGFISSLDVNPWTILIIMQLSLFILGTIVDDYAIIMLAGPIYVPIIKMLGFDPLWFGILFILNMSQAYLTPPYGFNLFYLRGLTPFIKESTGIEITMWDIYRGVFPFVGLKGLNLILMMVFPRLVLWLPTLVYG
ncbi:MAG TPA: TRAP transporter large permease subunit [Deltaproteobacteria bacterium]|nr:TRAP transporter large permease subunit [Deltaproteobacteria bacterium]